MMRALVVTETGDAWPSGFVRALIYRDLLAAHGFEVRYETRRSARLTRLREQPAPLLRRAIASGGQGLLDAIDRRSTASREAAILRAAPAFDVIYLQKVASWPLVEALRALPGRRLVYDLNDAVWLPRWGSFARGRIREILRTVDAVTCDNPISLAFARQENPNVYLVPDPPQVERFDALRAGAGSRGEEVVLGWVGSPGTAYNLFAAWEALERLFARHPGIELRLLGTGHDPARLPPFEAVRVSTLPFYSQEEMIREILRMDIGLFPLFDVEDSRARGILKATLYMSGEAAVVCSNVGQCAELIRPGENGMLARSPREWEECLETLITDHDLRRRIAASALETVRRHFSLERCFQGLRDALTGAPARDRSEP